MPGISVLLLFCQIVIVNFVFCQLAILPFCHLVYLPLCQNARHLCLFAILSNCHCQLCILSTCSLINLPVSHLSIRQGAFLNNMTTCCFVNESFCSFFHVAFFQFDIFSSYHLVNLPVSQSAKTAIFNHKK
jgi:hypothetical protein